MGVIAPPPCLTYPGKHPHPLILSLSKDQAVSHPRSSITTPANAGAHSLPETANPSYTFPLLHASHHLNSCYNKT